MPTKPYTDTLYPRLKSNPKLAAHYLMDALEDPDPAVFLVALRDVVTANGGVTEVAEKAGMHRTSAYRMTSENGNPEVRRLSALLRALKLKLSIEPLEQKPPRRKSAAA